MTELKKYELGDMQAVYRFDGPTGNVELQLLPAGTEARSEAVGRCSPDSLVQIKIIGDDYPGAYAGGRTLRNGKTSADFKFESQEVSSADNGTDICTVLRDPRNYVLEHHLCHDDGAESLWSYVIFRNEGNERAGLELLSSFSIAGIPADEKGLEPGQLCLHRIRSVWSMEGRHESTSFEDLQLEPSWSGHATRCERYGAVGSMPVNGFFPYVVVEDRAEDIFWGAQVAHNASWQIEVYRKGDQAAVSGGLADREFGHWLKYIEPKESFRTPGAILSVCKGGGIDAISQRLTSALDKKIDDGPKSEQDLPVIFNEYCTTWGTPSDENVRRIADVLRGRGISYFVIDCGWYKKEGVPWDIAMGDYNVSGELFPEGLKKTVDHLKDCGFKPGIWFEIDNVGEKAEAYNLTDHLLKRDGTVLSTTGRRFWDMRQDWVEEYLTGKVIDFLNEYGFEYMKMDYNDTIGLGCDGADSLGEGLRENMAASLSFIEKVKREVPGIILENCSSGGHKLEPLMMGTCSMASFSDAHECEEIPVVAANLHRVIQPRQSQIWAVIRKDDTLKRIAYSVAAGFLGRLCLSGDVLDLKKEQWDVIDRGIGFYKLIAPVIKKGKSRLLGTRQAAWRHPAGWQCVLRRGASGDAVAVYHTFCKEHDGELAAELTGNYSIEAVYSDKEAVTRIEAGRLICEIPEDMRAVAVYLKPL